MYQFMYQYKMIGRDNSEQLETNQTVLTARFSFSQEVPPNKRQEVKERCNLKPISYKISQGNYGYKEAPLMQFLTKKLHYVASQGVLQGTEFLNNRETIKIFHFTFFYKD